MTRTAAMPIVMKAAVVDGRSTPTVEVGPTIRCTNNDKDACVGNGQDVVTVVVPPGAGGAGSDGGNGNSGDSAVTNGSSPECSVFRTEQPKTPCIPDEPGL